LVIPLVILGLIIVLIAILQLPFFRVQTVELEGDPSFQTKLDSLKNTPIFSFRLKGKVAAIKAENSVIEDLYCKKGLPHFLRCRLTLRQPVLTWQRQGVYYLVDQVGDVYQQVDQPRSETILVNDQFPNPTQIGQNVAGSDIVARYQKLAKLLKDYGFTFDQYLVTGTVYQVQTSIVSFKTNGQANEKKFIAYFNLNNSLEDQLKVLSSTVGQKSEAIHSLVDLRVPSVVYLK